MAKHWSDSLQGSILTPAELTQRFLQSQIPISGVTWIPPAWLPTVEQVARLIMRAKVGATWGEDTIPTLLPRRCPSAFAEVLHPIICKALIHKQEPLQWSGGMCVEIPKPFKLEVSTDTFEAYRGIMVSDLAGKVYHAWLRSLILQSLNS